MFAKTVDLITVKHKIPQNASKNTACLSVKHKIQPNASKNTVVCISVKDKMPPNIVLIEVNAVQQQRK